MTAVVTALALVALVGFAGLAVDVGAWLYATRNMQATADQAAYSAALAAGNNGCSSTTATTQAVAIAATHGYVNGVRNTTVGVTCNTTNSTFTIRISQTQPMWFSRLFLAQAPTAAASATAQLAAQASDICVLALDGTDVSENVTGSDAQAGQMSGSGTLNLNCAIAVDSSSTSALYFNNSAAALTASEIYIVGNEPDSNFSYCSGGEGTLINGCATANQVLVGQSPLADPYLDRVVPPLSQCDYGSSTQGYGIGTASSDKNKSFTMSPGVYCNGLSLGSNSNGNHNTSITLNPGAYYIVGGSLSINASARITASGVTFVLTGSNPLCSGCGYATAQINGNSQLTMTAPNSNTSGWTNPASAGGSSTAINNFYGLAFFQDHNAPQSTIQTCGGQVQNKLNGGSGQLINGAVYFPNQAVCYTGNSATTGPGRCTQLIARSLDFTGSSSVQLSCAGTGVTSISTPVPQLVK